jgi:hypothetical protein
LLTDQTNGRPHTLRHAPSGGTISLKLQKLPNRSRTLELRGTGAIARRSQIARNGELGLTACGGVWIFNPAKRRRRRGNPADLSVHWISIAARFRGEARVGKKRREKASAKAETGSVEREGKGGAAVGLNRSRRTRRLKMWRLCVDDRWVRGPRGSGRWRGAGGQ